MPIGVYVCHCGLNIAGVLDIEELKSFAEKLPDVAVARDLQFSCSDIGQEQIQKDIAEYKLDRIVVAACSPRLHEPTFRRAIAKAGLNPYMLEMANIREQCSWVHMDLPAMATEKAKDLISMAVAKAALLQPLEQEQIPVNKDVLVVGGGVAGIAAALDLADAGFHVFLVERRPTIGGYMALLTDVFPTNDCSICVLGPKMSEVFNHPNITLYTYSEVLGVEGSVGNFTVSGAHRARYVDPVLCKGCINECADVCPVEVPNDYDFGIGKRKAIYVPYPQAVPLSACVDPKACIGCGRCVESCPTQAVKLDQVIEHFKINVGAIIVATGWQPFDAARKEEYGFGRLRDVVTTLQMERMLNASGPTKGEVVRPSTGQVAQSIAFLQCVGSRDATVGNIYCSRICCMASLKNAQLIAEKYPCSNITIYYIDIRAGGEGYEEFYIRAQRLGINFVRARVSSIEEVDGDIYLSFEDTQTGEIKRVRHDIAVLSVGLEPDKSADVLGNLLGLSRRPDRFFEIAHPKMRPVEAHIDGVFIAGCASGPKEIPISIAQGSAAAAKAIRLLQKGFLDLEPTSAYVDPDLCIRCKLCVDVCPQKAISVKSPAYVDEAACKGCGSCAAACPVDAIKMRLFSDEQILAQVRAATEVKKEFPLIIAFLCNWCSYGAADLAGTSRIQYPTNARNIRVMCSARVDPSFVLEALRRGADGVLIAGCRIGECHYHDGNYQALQRVNVLKGVLEKIGIDPRRVKIVWCAASEGEIYAKDLREFIGELKAIGPIGTELDKRRKGPGGGKAEKEAGREAEADLNEEAEIQSESMMAKGSEGQHDGD
ncbi:MAG: CoB-CoM heterodisulfide reductase HdrA2 [Methanothrix sp.]|jgi:heterodisulfide reductase subunit A|uniref:CoB-CoM heterodisulfide reductase HdrA2 n=1 Tax=Methanothrix sp. TaxID=90426 RepID=UPI0025FC3A20|nr:CoB-CoM heterodisulfide reductase HdrA2 [Methanothrix sp.]MCK9407372.1 CoB-CoM heterodisulfide reductase HdrA2 [Methanothrix sp.]